MAGRMPVQVGAAALQKANGGHGVLPGGVPGVRHCVTNMPGAVPRTSTFALTNATLPYVKALARHGIEEALTLDPYLAQGLNVHAGAIRHEAVARDLGLPFRPYAPFDVHSA